MLLIDGVKYLEWAPEGDRAEEELEQIVKKHASEIFGENSIYVDIKHKLKSKAGTGTIPDGYVITFGDNPQLHIVEVELFNHSYDHIISQITKIITCLKDSSTWNDIARTIRDEINKDELTAIKAKKAIQSGEVYEFLYDRISNLASLVIVIDKDRMDVREGIGNITHREIKMIEFRTFKRVGAEAVHAHLFEPLFKEVTPVQNELTDTKGENIENAMFMTVENFWTKYKRLRVASRCLADLSLSHDISFKLETDIGTIDTKIDKWNQICVGMGKWYKAHPELKTGDTLVFTVIEPMKKYRLEIVK